MLIANAYSTKKTQTIVLLIQILSSFFHKQIKRSQAKLLLSAYNRILFKGCRKFIFYYYNALRFYCFCDALQKCYTLYIALLY